MRREPSRRTIDMVRPDRVGYASLRALRRAVSTFAPMRCVICGLPADADSRYPLCARCAGRLLDEALESAELSRPAARDPSRCPVCGKLAVSELGPCMRCRSAGYRFDSALPLLRYSGDARAALLSYKAGRTSLASFFADALAVALSGHYSGRTVVPVPPRPGKIRRYGWDQVERIARILERRHGIAVARVLKRAGGHQQKSLGLEARAVNMRGAISLRRGAEAPLAPVLLDDVMTTGATLSACADALKGAGAGRVDAIVIAAD